MNKPLTLLFLCCLLALVGCGANEPSPGDTVKDFTYAMEAGDAEKVRQLAPGLAKYGSDKLDGLVAESAGDIAEEGGIESIEILEENINDKTATVKARIEMGNGETEEESFELSKVQDRWIIRFDVSKENDEEDEEDDDQNADDARAEDASADEQETPTP